MKYVKEFLIRKMKLKPLGTLRLGMFETIPGTDCKGQEIKRLMICFSAFIPTSQKAY